MTNEELIQAIRTGDRSLMMTLWTQNTGIVYRIARRYLKEGDDLEDLAQEGYIIMDQAVKTWQPGKCSFVTWFVHALNWSYFRYVNNTGRHPVPQHIFTAAVKYGRALQTFTEITGKKPTDYELAVYMGIPEKTLEAVKLLLYHPLSLDKPADEEGASWYDIIPDGSDMEADAINRVDTELLHRALDEAMEVTLTHKHADIIRRRFYQDQTIDEIAEEIGSDREEIHKVTSAAMHSLRRSRAVKKKLRPFLEAYENGLKGVGTRRFLETWTSSTERAALRLCG